MPWHGPAPTFKIWPPVQKVIGRLGWSPAMPMDSTIVVPVPDAEPVVDRWRRRLDPSRRQRMPAHITVLTPFLAPSMIDGVVIARLAELFGEVDSFDFSLMHTEWFDRRVVYLAPEPVDPFLEMTEAVQASFPAYRPYGGVFATVVPHLTVAEGAHPLRLRRAASHVDVKLPINARASDVWLMVRDIAPTWRRLHAFALGDGSRPTEDDLDRAPG